MPSLNFTYDSFITQCCCIKRHHRVEPTYPVCPSGGFMFQVNPCRVLRIIHRIPKSKQQKAIILNNVPVPSENKFDSQSKATRWSVEYQDDVRPDEVCVAEFGASEKGADAPEDERLEHPKIQSIQDFAEQLVMTAFFFGLQKYVEAATATRSSRCVDVSHDDDTDFSGNEPLLNGTDSGADGTNNILDDGIANPAFSDMWPEEGENNESNALGHPEMTRKASNERPSSGLAPTYEAAGAKYKNCFPSFYECDSLASQSTERSSCIATDASQENLFGSEKPLMFFVHGVGGSANMWHGQMSHFCDQGFECVAVDLIGHGFSSMPKSVKEYSFKAILNDLLTVFDRFSKKRNVVVGHSYGCSLAAAMSHERSSKVSHLVLISGGGPVSLSPHPGTLSLPACLVACMKPFVNCGLQRRALYSATGRQMLYCSRIELPRYVLQYIRQGQKWPEGDISFYKQIKIPTLLLYGMKDPHITLVEECEMEKAISRASLELIPDAGHLVMLDAPHNVNVLIQRFLNRWEKRK